MFATLANQKKQKTKLRDDSKLSTQGWQMPMGFLPQLDEFYFTTAEKKLFWKIADALFRISPMTNSFK